jgi:uncharacterized protein (TIGR03000 family)
LIGGYGLGYGLGYGGYGYGLGYGGYGYNTYPSYDYSGAYAYPATPTVVGGGIVQASGLAPSAPAPTPTVAGPANVTVVVPDGAQVWFDGKETTSTGGSRVFTSSTLQPDQTAVLSVKARWNGNTYSMQLPIHAGDKFSVDLR